MHTKGDKLSPTYRPIISSIQVYCSYQTIPNSSYRFALVTLSVAAFSASPARPFKISIDTSLPSLSSPSSLPTFRPSSLNIFIVSASLYSVMHIPFTSVRFPIKNILIAYSIGISSMALSTASPISNPAFRLSRI